MKWFHLINKWLLVIVLIMFLAACSESAPPAPDVTQAPLISVDGRGKEITFPALPQRIISMAPSNTELLFAAGVGAQVVGRDEFSDFPAEALQIESIGGSWGEYNLEKILALDPDLILAAEIVSAEQIQAIEDLGLTVYLLPNPNNFNELFENILEIGRITRNSQQAELLVAELKARVDAVSTKISISSSLPLVFYELDASDPNAPYTAGKGTFIDTLITMAGGINLGAQLDGEWVPINVETLIAANPDVIILGDYTWGGITPEMVESRSGWDATRAVQMGYVYTFDDNLVSRPGPRMVDGLELMARLIHPELFDE